MGTETYTPPASGPTSVTIDHAGHYRVEEVIRSEAECKCPACVLWTIVYDDPDPTEIGTSWQGDDGLEMAQDICDLMNMAYEAGLESNAVGKKGDV